MAIRRSRKRPKHDSCRTDTHMQDATRSQLLSDYRESACRAFDRDEDLTFRYGFRFTQEFYLFAQKCAAGVFLGLIRLGTHAFVPHHIGANPNVHALHHNVINAT